MVVNEAEKTPSWNLHFGAEVTGEEKYTSSRLHNVSHSGECCGGKKEVAKMDRGRWGWSGVAILDQVNRLPPG